MFLWYFLVSSGIPLSKPLYTLSYMFITAGASGFLLTIIFYIVSSFAEVQSFKFPFSKS